MKKSFALIMVALLMFLSVSVFAGTYEAAKGTPVIDAEKDDLYEAAQEVPIAIEGGGGTGNATGSAWILWDADNIYYYAEVKDAVLSTAKAADDTKYQTDSIEFYIDLVNDGNDNDITATNAGQYTSSILYEGEYGGYGQHYNTYGTQSTFKVKTISGGYVIEGQIIWGAEYTPAENNTIGFTVAINDDSDNTSVRTFQTFVSEGQTSAWSNTGSYDDLVLTGKEYVPEVILEETPAGTPAADAPATAAPTEQTPAANVAAPQTSDMSIILLGIAAFLSCGTVLAVAKKKR
jgi:hypothetical protein